MNQEIIDQMYGQPSTTAVQTEQEDIAPAAVEVAPVEQDHGYEKPETAENPYSLDDVDSLESQLSYADSERVELADDVDLSLIYQSEEEQAVLADNLAFIGSAVGAEQQQMSSLVESCNEYMLTGESPPEKETMKALYNAYGPSLHTKLANAQGLVKSFPDLHQWLEETGAGNSPAIIRQIIKLSETDRSQARLKTLRNK